MSNGFLGLVLTLENQTPIDSPTLSQLTAAVDSLTPRGGPGFLILEAPSGDYTQAAGGDGKFTAEWRDHPNGKFRHWVAGIGETVSEEVVEVGTHDACVT